MGGATVPSPGGGIGQMAFPSSAEPNPILKGLRGSGPEQVINQILPPQGPPSSGPAQPPSAAPPSGPPNYNFPVMNFKAPYNPGYYWNLNSMGQLQLLPANVDQTGALQPLMYGTASQLGITNGANVGGLFQPGTSNLQANPQSELSYLQSTYPYQGPSNSNIPGALPGASYPSFWSSPQMTQWAGPSSLGSLMSGQ